MYKNRRCRPARAMVSGPWPVRWLRRRSNSSRVENWITIRPRPWDDWRMLTLVPQRRSQFLLQRGEVVAAAAGGTLCGFGFATDHASADPRRPRGSSLALAPRSRGRSGLGLNPLAEIELLALVAQRQQRPGVALRDRAGADGVLHAAGSSSKRIRLAIVERSMFSRPAKSSCVQP